MVTCSPERPWGIHPELRSDEECRRCGWTAPGPKGDALADALEAQALAAVLGWTAQGGDSAGQHAA